jgi:hypothetical protein
MLDSACAAIATVTTQIDPSQSRAAGRRLRRWKYVRAANRDTAAPNPYTVANPHLRTASPEPSVRERHRWERHEPR